MIKILLKINKIDKENCLQKCGIIGIDYLKNYSITNL